jgi:hypothetical protein
VHDASRHSPDACRLRRLGPAAVRARRAGRCAEQAWSGARVSGRRARGRVGSKACAEQPNGVSCERGCGPGCAARRQHQRGDDSSPSGRATPVAKRGTGARGATTALPCMRVAGRQPKAPHVRVRRADARVRPFVRPAWLRPRFVRDCRPDGPPSGSRSELRRGPDADSEEPRAPTYRGSRATATSCPAAGSACGNCWMLSPGQSIKRNSNSSCPS